MTGKQLKETIIETLANEAAAAVENQFSRDQSDAELNVARSQERSVTSPSTGTYRRRTQIKVKKLA